MSEKLIFIVEPCDRSAINTFTRWVFDVLAREALGTPYYEKMPEADWKGIAQRYVIHNTMDFTWVEFLGMGVPVVCGPARIALCPDKAKSRPGMHDMDTQPFATLPGIPEIQAMTRRRDAGGMAGLAQLGDVILAADAMARGDKPFSTMTHVGYIMGVQRLDQVLDWCKSAGQVCFDFETKPRYSGLTKKDELKAASVDFNRCLPTMIGLGFQPGGAWVLPLFHHHSPWAVCAGDEITVVDGTLRINGDTVVRYNGRVVREAEDPELFELVHTSMMENLAFANEHGYADLVRDYLVPRLNIIFNDPEVRKVAHNIKFDYKVGRAMGCEFRGRLDDTLSMDHYLREDRAHGLKDIAARVYPEFSGYEEDIDYASGDLLDLGEYCGRDIDLTLRLSYLLENELLQDARVYNCYRSLETVKCDMLARMEYRGMRVDRKALEEGLASVTARIAEKEGAIRNHPVVRRFVAAKSDELRGGRRDELRESIMGVCNQKLVTLQSRAVPKEGTKGRAVYDRELQLLESGDWYAPDHPIARVRTWAAELAGLDAGVGAAYEFNLASSQQLGELIYTHPAGLGHKMPVAMSTRKNKETGRTEKVRGVAPSVNKDYLLELQDDTGLLDNIITLGVLDTLKGTYLEGIRDTMDLDDHVHSSFSTVKTHRLSSSNPNLQNIPSRTKVEEVIEAVEGIKRMFIPERGGNYVMYQADLKTAELRWAAYLWDIRSMTRAFKQNIDLHVLVSTNANGMTLADYDRLKADDPKKAKQLRHDGKADNFGMIFKVSPKGYQLFAKKSYGLDLTLAEAEHRHRAYFKLHPDVIQGHATCIARAQKFGYVRTRFGVKRHTPNIIDLNPQYRGEEERVSVNSPVQGSNGQGLLFSLCIHDMRMKMLLPEEWETEAWTSNTVHDSAVGWCREDLQAVVLPELVEAMNLPPTAQYFGFDFADLLMETDVEAGPNWKDLKPWANA